MMYGSPSATAAKDLNLPCFFRKGESDPERQQQISSGLLRYRSAPPSVLGDVCENFLSVRPSSPETESMFVRLLSPDLREKPAVASERNPNSNPNPNPNPHFKSPAEAEQNNVFSIGANLIRQNSSPAGFYSHLNIDNWQINFSSRQNSLSQISEMGNDGVPGYPPSCWEEPMLSDSYSDFKRLNQTELRNEEIKNHQVFSLPKSSSEMAAIEKFFQFQDSVPCKIRAKRGCATHPRSIAERVRRTRISERMRKLQELVPNMDKQTNTADMLDLAVDHIKDLQEQVKVLTDCRAACTCLASKQKPYHNQTR